MKTMTRGKPEVLWHYTKGMCMPSILREGQIRVASGQCEPNERPAVWFSANQVWEPTVYMIGFVNGRQQIITRDEMCDLVGGLFRIGVRPDVAPHNWDDFRRLSGVSAGMASHLKKVGYEVGARISEWFVTFDPVPSEKWVAVESWNGRAWEAAPHPEAKVNASQTA